MEVFRWNIQDCAAAGQHYHIVCNENFPSRKKNNSDFCLKKLGIKRKSNGVVTDEEKSLFHQTIKT